jgi:hypothetical protein
VGAPVIPLHGRSRLLELSGVVPTDVWRIARPDELPDGRTPLAWLVDPRSDRLPLGYGLYLRAGRDGSTPAPPDGAPLLQLPANLHHVGPGDVLNVSPDGSRTGVLWKASARHNSLLLTEQCDNLCIMCSQPPKAADDRWLIQRAKRVVRLLSEDSPEVSRPSAVTICSISCGSACGWRRARRCTCCPTVAGSAIPFSRRSMRTWDIPG